MKLYLCSCESGPDAWEGNRDSLVKLASLATLKKHGIVSDPAQADAILITDLRDTNYFESLRSHHLVSQHAHKCYAYSEDDGPMRLLRGIYPSMPRSILNLNRFRSSPYLTCYSEWQNPFVSLATNVKKDLFFSFIGRSSADVRRRLFQLDFGRDDIVIEHVAYKNWVTSGTERETAQRRYVDVTSRSQFVLCPRGAGPSSIRLFEVMEMGCVPVILSDRWMPPRGPDWSEFAIFIAEKDVDQIPMILSKYEDRWQTMAQRARKSWEEWFAPDKQFNFVVDNIESIKRGSIIPERVFCALWVLMVIRKKYIRPRSFLALLKNYLTPIRGLLSFRRAS
jgi:hypothetical protein